jgi:hypothetical protein
MATTRKTAKPKKDQPSMSFRMLLIVMLLLGLTLSAINLALMTANVGTLTGLREAFADLQANYASRRIASQPVPTPEPPMPQPPVIFSVVKYRDASEEARLRMDLAGLIVEYYGESPWPAPLTALLIERKNAGSRDVNVRIFFGDGSETSYLWPSTNAVDGKWVPPCSTSGSPDQLMCPPMFSARHPDLVALTR